MNSSNKPLTQEEIDEVCRKKQREIIANFKMSEKQRQEMELENDDWEKYYPQDDDLLRGAFNQLSNKENKNSYFIKNVDESQLQNWEDYEVTLDKTKSELIIEPNKYRFNDNKLVINKADYPNLKIIYACGVGLESVEINHDGLESLNLTSNKLSDINLQTPNLNSLSLGDNRISRIEVKHLEGLKYLRLNNNCIKKLDVRGMQLLKFLDASHNLKFEYYVPDYNDDFDDFFGFEEILLGDNPDLENLDLGENQIEKLDFPWLPKLSDLSLRQNKKSIGKLTPQKKTLILRSPKLAFLDYHDSNIEKVIHKEGLEGSIEICNDESYQNKDGTHNPSVSTRWEQRQLEKQKQKEKADFESGKHTFEGQVCLDLSNRDYIKSITIDGDKDYPQSLESINLGGNYLSEVIIRNLPNLIKLIISHNRVKKFVTDNCPLLSIVYEYKSNDNNRTPPPDAREYNEETDNPLDEKNQPKHPEDFVHEEMERKKEQFIKDLLILITDIESDANKGDWKSVKEKITKIKEYILLYSLDNQEINERINKLEKRLLSQTITSSQNPWPLIIGSIITIPITLGIVVLLAKKWVAYDLKRQIQSAKKNSNHPC